MLQSIRISIGEFGVKDAIDILLVTFIIYGLLIITRKTRAIQVLKGLGVFLLFALICQWIGLTAVSALLNYVIEAGAVIIVVIFQPEIRKALERVGRGRFFGIGFDNNMVSEDTKDIENIERAILNLSIRKIGALMVFERKTGLKDIIESGTTLDARISSELIENIFVPNSPMHDGAMILKNNRIVAAGCFLPLSNNPNLSSDLGTRHRAGLGMSEMSDAVIIIVSEETGIISKAHDGVLSRYIDRKALRGILNELYASPETASKKIRSIGSVFRRKERQDDEKDS
ncbi:MAG TPA: TIGR00159 family protein [Candidatus Scybalosoma faecavium]|nr:TIGR00159 family protein [Candidatus Scybalosoma faecavium]